MQGREENVLASSDKLVAFKKKVAIWKKTELKMITLKYSL